MLSDEAHHEVVTAPAYHVPVLLKPTVDGLSVRPDGVYVDVTFGGGGHSREILSRLGPKGHLFSFDQDAEARRNVPPDEPRLTFIPANFRYLGRWMRYYEVESVDGILADLGVSSHHFDDAERGFSFRFDAPLDMRMNRNAGFTAADVVNTYEEVDLARVIIQYGELQTGRRMARALVKRRAASPLRTVSDLTETVAPLISPARMKRDMARVFQALRIEVNHELDALAEMLEAAGRILRPGGRLSVLTYHSLEDRMVKNFIRSGNIEGRMEQDFFGRLLAPLRAVNHRVVVPDEAEQAANPRSRSAKLRVAERVAI